MITMTVCLKIGSRGNIDLCFLIVKAYSCSWCNHFLLGSKTLNFPDHLARLTRVKVRIVYGECIHTHYFPKWSIYFFYLLLISNTCNQYVSLLIIDLSSANWENSKLFQEEVRPENNSQLHGFRKFLQLI